MFLFLSRKMNDIKIRNKLIISFVVVVFVPVLIVSVFLTSELRRMSFDKAIEQASINVERVKERTAEVVNVSNDISYRLSYDNRLKMVASRQYESVYDVVQAYHDYPDFQQYIRLYKEITNIRFYASNPTMLDNWEFIQPSDQIIQSSWYKNALNSKGFISWNFIEDERDRNKYLSLVRKISLLNQHNSGVLVINVNIDMLNAILHQESFETMIVDDNNNIVAANRPEWYGKTLSDIDFDTSILNLRTSGNYEAVIGDIESRVVIESLIPDNSLNGLKIISVFSVDSIMQDTNRIIRLAVTVISISLLVAIILIYSFSNLISDRLLRLSKKITKVGIGNLDVTIQMDGTDEIGVLSRQFNSMVRNINDLVSEVQQGDEQKRLLEQRQNQIKFKMMASQINPHFLFNSLEAIRMAAHMKGEVEIARVVRLLGKMMRNNLEVGTGTIRLKEEIDMVQCYLDIQKFRYEGRLNYRVIIDPDIQNVPILPLIIQPLVENAVIHSIDTKEEGVVLLVKAIKSGENILFQVNDNGTGISAERLEYIRKYLNDNEEENRERIGLRNVHARLQLAYGSEHGLEISSTLGQGTYIQFTIPLGGRVYDQSDNSG